MDKLIKINDNYAIYKPEEGGTSKAFRIDVSDHIKKAAGSVRLFGEVRTIQIEGIPHKALKAYGGDNKEYVVSVIRGYWSWSSCTCAGYRYTGFCKHIYKANQYLDKISSKSE